MNDDREDQPNQGQSSEDVPASAPCLVTPEFRSGRRMLDAPPTSPDSRIQGGSIRLFRVAGIDVLLHWSWFFFAVLRLQSNSSGDSCGFAHYPNRKVWYVVEYLPRIIHKRVRCGHQIPMTGQRTPGRAVGSQQRRATPCPHSLVRVVPRFSPSSRLGRPDGLRRADRSVQRCPDGASCHSTAPRSGDSSRSPSPPL